MIKLHPKHPQLIEYHIKPDEKSERGSLAHLQLHYDALRTPAVTLALARIATEVMQCCTNET